MDWRKTRNDTITTKGTAMRYRLQLISTFVLATFIAVTGIHAGEPPTIFSSVISRTYGPKNELCTTQGTVLSSADNWLDRLKNAKPGNIFLLRAGTYDISANLALPHGDANNPIVVQPYNCEAATLFGKSNAQGIGTTLSPGSYNTIAGIRVESATHEKLIEIAANVRNVEFRNNTLYGGRNDAITIIGGVANILFSGNDINSGPAQPGGITGSSGGHVFVIGNRETAVPNAVRIVRNKIRGSYFGNVTAGDDTIAVSGGNNVV
ncbi:MAG TPA: hypothetical protein VLJ79_33075, partial [Candidatus Binatia bacterium]|nr:hypothetical protein [Candidatus Binatia bacterium]